MFPLDKEIVCRLPGKPFLFLFIAGWENPTHREDPRFILYMLRKSRTMDHIPHPPVRPHVAPAPPARAADTPPAVPAVTTPSDAPAPAEVQVTVLAPPANQAIPSGPKAVTFHESGLKIGPPMSARMLATSKPNSAEDEDDVVNDDHQRAAGGSKRRMPVKDIKIHNPSCSGCRKGNRKCHEETGGGACYWCKVNKSKCEYSNRKDLLDIGKAKSTGSKFEDISEGEKIKSQPPGAAVREGNSLIH
jgi:hypothetical protein